MRSTWNGILSSVSVSHRGSLSAQLGCPILSLSRETQEAILTLVDADAIAELDDCLRNGGDARPLYATRLKTRLTAAMVCRRWNKLLEGSELWVDAEEVWVWSQRNYPNFCDEALLALTRRCQNLSRLTVSYHPQLTDAGVVGAVELLREFPEAGRTVPEFQDPTLRELLHGHYRIVYEASEDAVHVLAIHHGARLLRKRPSI